MKKIISAFLILGFLSLNAKGLENKLSSTDAQILFNQEVSNVTLLDEEQMQEIQGEFWGWQVFAIGFIVGVGKWGYNCFILHQCKNFSVSFSGSL